MMSLPLAFATPNRVTLLVIVAVLNIPLYLLLGKSFFKDWEGFFEALIGASQSDLGSALAGGYEEHKASQFTVLMFAVVCLVTTAAEYHVVALYLFGIEQPWAFEK